MAAFSEWKLDCIAHHKAIAEKPFSATAWSAFGLSEPKAEIAT